MSLEIEAGDYVAIMGPSGSGKSTLLNILGLLDVPTNGRYLLEGQDIAKETDARRSRRRNQTFGFVFQLFHLLPRLTVRENVLLPRLYGREELDDIEERADVLIRRLGLEARRRSFPGVLSGGERQRVAIARALLNEPRILLADEPTGNLDQAAGREVLDIFRELSREGQTLVVVTHDSNVAAEAQRVLSMSDGRLTECQP
ncbi:MAG: ABC transporter ATP-binding protein [Thermoanaerobaculia bacterium]|nr:ABC transporter ATP-binding protein [Thermoanaerobaculia bacterium]